MAKIQAGALAGLEMFDLLGGTVTGTLRINICEEILEPPERLRRRLSDEMLVINMEPKNNLPSYERLQGF